nr:SO_0444 family Cu/Zn efflux transporter [Desulfosediminicola flagellatus]
MLPAAASLQKQGANKGATTAFLISTPESGVDSIAITYALLDPIMTVIRPIAAFLSAIAAGLLENTINWSEPEKQTKVNRSCPVDNCCDGESCSEEEHKNHHSKREKVLAGFRYAVIDVWGDIAIWFYVGLLIAAVITVLIPDELMVSLLGGGFSSMLIMLVIGIPLYICATASTPVAAALILKGVSPGAALVFLLVGPATNVTSLSVLFGILGKKSTFRYLTVLATTAVMFGLAVDQIYAMLGISPQAIIGEAAEIIPEPIKLVAVLVLAVFSVKPLMAQFKKMTNRKKSQTYVVANFPDLRSNPIHGLKPNNSHAESGACGCGNHGANE